jgi:hypothetical protein
VRPVTSGTGLISGAGSMPTTEKPVLVNHVVNESQ